MLNSNMSIDAIDIQEAPKSMRAQMASYFSQVRDGF